MYYNTKEKQCQANITKNNKVIDLYKKHSYAAAKRTEELSKAYLQLYNDTGSEYYKRRYEAVVNCHDYALFRKYLDPNDTTELKKLNRCKNPLCTFCNWVEAKKKYSILAGTVTQLKESGVPLIHCVITVPNCNIKDLNKQINILHKIITRTLRHFKVSGYYRATEITYNKKNDDYHPHAHLLITDYIPIYQLTAFTAKIYKEYDPDYNRDYTICYISKCNYVKELCKYITKPNDYNQEQLKELIKNEAIHGIRKSARGGIIKNAYKQTDTIIKVLKKSKTTELEMFGFYDELIPLS